MKSKKNNQKMGLDEEDPFEYINNSLLERGFTQEEIDRQVRKIIVKKEGIISEEMALMILLSEITELDTEEDDDSEEDNEHSDESNYKRVLELEDWIEIGNGFYDEGLFYEAMKYYERALDEDPELTQIWKKLGNCNLKIGEYDDANICFVIARRPVIDVKEIAEEIQAENIALLEMGEDSEWTLYEEGEFQGDDDDEDGDYNNGDDEFQGDEEIPFVTTNRKIMSTRAEKNRLKRMYEEMELSIIEIPSDAWDYLVDGSNDSLWDYPVTLSCNSRKDVWFCVKYGRHRESERRYIDLKEFPFLEDIVDLILEINPRGGRLHLTHNRAYLKQSSKYKKICVIVVE